VVRTLTLDKDGNPLTADDVLHGDSFEGDVFQVLDTLHAADGWID
jgi:hypothetical protein